MVWVGGWVGACVRAEKVAIKREQSLSIGLHMQSFLLHFLECVEPASGFVARASPAWGPRHTRQRLVATYL